jgi:hypothetical protein
MSQYSEATLRVFERALDRLKGKLDEDRLATLRGLVAKGQLGDLEQVERILGPKGGIRSAD